MDVKYKFDELLFGAKEEARFQLRELIIEECDYDIKECDDPEAEIELFLKIRPVAFDEQGNIV